MAQWQDRPTPFKKKKDTRFYFNGYDWRRVKIVAGHWSLLCVCLGLHSPVLFSSGVWTKRDISIFNLATLFFLYSNDGGGWRTVGKKKEKEHTTKHRNFFHFHFPSFFNFHSEFSRRSKNERSCPVAKLSNFRFSQVFYSIF